MNAEKACPQCGAPVSAESLEGLCPACLLRQGFAEPSTIDEPSGSARTVADQPAAVEPAGISNPPARIFGDYEIIEEIARGGMGIVYKARQVSLKRTVAVKMILAGRLAGYAESRRFRAEAESAAQLQHPNIVAIHEVGEQEGQHFFSMDYVEGPSLAELCQYTPLPPEKAAFYVRTIAEAIQYAHGKGILHRDLKPSNVLIDTNDQPRVTDFGLAKRLEDQSELTLSGAVMGSPSYMPPEQAAGKQAEVGPGSDVYSLGAILYHLLTGRPPFQAATPVETLRQVIDREPAPPRWVNPSVPIDLETICSKCLEKDAKRRYESARHLADDLGRHLRREPISARRIGAWERAHKWIKRRPAIAALSGLMAVAVLLLILSIGLGFVQTTRALSQSNWHLYLAEMQLAHQAALADEDGRVQALLDRWLPQDDRPDRRGWEWYYLRAGCRNLVTLTGPEEKDTFLKRLNRLRRPSHFDPRASRVVSVSWSPDGGRVAFLHSRGTIRIFDVRRRTVVSEINDNIVTATSSLAWSPDGRSLALGVIEMGSLIPSGTAPGASVLRIVDVATGIIQARLTGHRSQIAAVAWHPSGERLASGSHDGKAILWDATTGQPIATLQGSLNHRNSLAFSPDGLRIAMAVKAGAVEIWNSAFDERLLEIQAHDEPVISLAWSPDGERLATAVRHIEVWDSVTGRKVRSLGEPGPGRLLWSIAWSWDSAFLAAGLSQGIIEVWPLENNNGPLSLNGHGDAVDSLSWHPNQPLLASGSWDNTVKIWDLAPRQAYRHYSLSDRRLASVDWKPNSSVIAVSGNDGIIRVIEADGGNVLRETRGHGAPVNTVIWSPDGRRLASGGSDGRVRIWTDADTEPLVTLPTGGKSVAALAWNPTGELLASCDFDANEIKVWDARAGRERTNFKGHGDRVLSLAWSPSGDQLASGSLDLTVRLWRMDAGNDARVLRWHRGWIGSIAWSPAGRHLATASGDRTVKIWDAPAGRETRVMTGHTAGVNFVAWSSDGRRIASASMDGTIKVWDSVSGQETITLRGSGTGFTGVAWSSDSRQLAAVDEAGVLRVWDASRDH